MTSVEFFELTEKVRRLQKEFFKTRDSTTYYKAKEYEQKLDEEIERVRKILDSRKGKEKNINPTLF